MYMFYFRWWLWWKAVLRSTAEQIHMQDENMIILLSMKMLSSRLTSSARLYRIISQGDNYQEDIITNLNVFGLTRFYPIGFIALLIIDWLFMQFYRCNNLLYFVPKITLAILRELQKSKYVLFTLSYRFRRSSKYQF